MQYGPIEHSQNGMIYASMSFRFDRIPLVRTSKPCDVNGHRTDQLEIDS